jgi:hypothetical protein
MLSGKNLPPGVFLLAERPIFSKWNRREIYDILGAASEGFWRLRISGEIGPREKRQINSKNGLNRKPWE